MKSLKSAKKLKYMKISEIFNILKYFLNFINFQKLSVPIFLFVEQKKLFLDFFAENLYII